MDCNADHDILGIFDILVQFFFFLSATWLTHGQLFGQSRGDIFTHPILIIVYANFRPKSQPCNEVGSLIPDGRLVGFEVGTFRFLLQCLNPLGHSPFHKPRFE